MTLDLQLTVAEPDVSGPLAVFPLRAAREPSLRYLSFAAAVRRGATVKELAGGASVNDLLVHNPLDVPVLLYEGEEVLGAQQNRTFDVSALVAASSTLRVPVSCVEAGRWDGARHAEAFAPAPQAAYPQLRRLKNTQARAAMAAGGEPRAVQREVWAEVAAASARHGVASPTAAMHDVYEGRRTGLRSLAEAVHLRPGQVGALSAVGGRFVVLDYVSDPDAWALLHGPIVQGYALDALEADAQAVPPSLDDARDFTALLLRAPCVPAPAVGLGSGLRFDFGGLAGTGLTCEGEIVALTAFATEPSDETPRTAAAPVAGRVRRPSQRRPAR